MNLILSLSIFLIISSIYVQSSISPCAQFYSDDFQQLTCDCENTTENGLLLVSLKCQGQSYVPSFPNHIHYKLIELESCTKDLPIAEKTFADLNINSLRLRHCNLVGLSEESFSRIHHLEKFHIENSTIVSLSTTTESFQDIFQSDSFSQLKSLILKNVHYHQTQKHDKKFNLELLLERFPYLHRLELVNIQLDNYRHHHANLTNRSLTYLKLINTHQSSLLPIERLSSLESLIIVHLPEIFRHQPLIASLKSLKHLGYIDLSHNQLTNIDGLQSKTIDQIDLRSNSIEMIDEYAFENVRRLRTLTLTDNPLRSIDKNAFCGVEHLKRLYINSQTPNQLSPLNNCLLMTNPELEIKQDVETKFHCDCQLVFLLNAERQEKKKVNRLLKMNDRCLVSNRTLDQTNNFRHLVNHYLQPISINDLERYLNCSTATHCPNACQDRRMKSATTNSPFDHRSSTGRIQTKNSLASNKFQSFLVLRLALFLLAFSYL